MRLLKSILLVSSVIGQDVEDRLSALEVRVNEQGKQINQLSVENARLNELINENTKNMLENRKDITLVDRRLEKIEDSFIDLTCENGALDVCKCHDGFQQVNGQCMSLSEEDAAEWIDEFNIGYQENVWGSSDAYFAYETNLTDYNYNQYLKESAKFGAFLSRELPKGEIYDYDSFEDELLKRQFWMLFRNGESLDAKESQELSAAQFDMSNTYSKGAVGREGECLRLESAGPGINSLEKIMATSTSYSERLWAWLGWRTNVGKEMRENYETYVDLKNKWARLNGFSDYGQYWRSDYEMEDDSFDNMAREEFEKIKPLYAELHAFVRYKYSQMEEFADVIDNDGGMLPANMLGDMWGRFWNGIYDFVVPYPEAPSIDVTEELVKQGYDEKKLFELGDDFFDSLGLERVNDIFWERSAIKRIPDVEMVCHPTAWDLGDGEDFRIKMCTEVTMDYLLTIHHEMGHIQYYMQYAHQPPMFRSGGNEGFHEAVGEVMAMNVATPEHLRAIDLLDPADDEETELKATINFLLYQSLQQVATMPFTIMLEEWRYGVFNETITKDVWMDEWWKMKNEWLGVKAPSSRDETDCDPAALFHVSSDYSMMRYFSRTIYQFQFQKELCEVAGHVGPLHECDIYQSTEAGHALHTLLKQGSSVHWLKQLQDMTGDENATLNADGLVKYYEPLYNWLKEENAKNGVKAGWDVSKTEFKEHGDIDFIGTCESQSTKMPSQYPDFRILEKLKIQRP